MLKPRRDLELALESLDVDATAQRRRQNLDDDFAGERGLFGDETRDIPPPPSSRSGV